MDDLLRDDEGEFRIMGTPTFVRAAIERIGSVLDVSYDGNLRPNRYGEGHRAHVHVRLADDRPAR